MKKRIICLVTALMMISALFFGCADSGDNVNAVELPKPTGLYVTKSDNTVHWDSVENASGYKVKINGTEYEVKENYYTIENADYGKSYEIEVVAVGDGKNYSQSEVSTTNYTLPTLTTEQDATSGIEYKLIGNTEVSVSKIKTVPINDIKGKLVIPDTYNGKFVTKIENSAFRAETVWDDIKLNKHHFEGANITEIVFPVKLKRIGMQAFVGQFNLESVTIPNGAEIETYAFAGCSKMKTAIIGAKIIGSGAFANCSNLDSVTLIDTGVIYAGAFAKIKADYLIIPESVVKVGQNIFNDTGKTIYYEGTQKKWENVADWQEDTCVYFYSEEKPSTEGMFWHYESNGKPVKW